MQWKPTAGKGGTPQLPFQSPSHNRLAAELSSHLVDLQEAIHLAALILLLLHFLAKAFPLALLYAVWVLEGPASPPVGFSDIITGVTTPAKAQAPPYQGQHDKEMLQLGT